MTPVPKEAYWNEKYATVARLAFERHVLELIQGYGPIQDALYRENHGQSSAVIFRNAELVGEYPKTRVRVYTYDRARDRELTGEYPIWDRDFAIGEIGKISEMHPPERIAGDMLVWARGG